MTSEDRKIPVKTPAGKTDGSIELPAELFDVEPNIALMHQVVNAQLAAKRQGTHSTKTRGEVSGGGKKPYRQKGTGRARQGSTRAPQFTGGGIVHGPKPRDYSERTPKKMIRAALRGALSDRARNDRIHAITEIVEGQTPSTKSAKSFLATLTDRRQVLVVIGRADATQLHDERGVTADQLLDGGEVISIAGVELEAIALRGHTPGSIAFVLSDAEPVIIFTGDSLFPGGVGNTGDDPERFAQLFADVLARIFDRFDDATIVYPGHGAETTLGAERAALPEWQQRGW